MGSGPSAKKYSATKEKLGTGAFGSVVKGKVRGKVGSFVAMKKVPRQQLVYKEIAIMRELDHDSCLRLIEHFAEGSQVLLILEYCENGDLENRLRRSSISSCSTAPVTEALGRTWMQQVLAAVGHLHSKTICHRDVKPENFLCTQNATRLKLADFGVATRCAADAGLTQPGLRDLAGTPAFMAPEIHCLPSLGYGLPVDIWAAGCTLYTILNGGNYPFVVNGRFQRDDVLQVKLKFRASQPKSMVPSSIEQFSPAAQGLCRTLICKEPTKRPRAGKALEDAWFTRAGTGSSTGRSFGAEPLSARDGDGLNRKEEGEGERDQYEEYMDFDEFNTVEAEPLRQCMPMRPPLPITPQQMYEGKVPAVLHV